jgi:hypothetical protein
VRFGAYTSPMIMTPGVRKFALTTHVTSSVGWLGAVAGFLALSIAGVTSTDGQIVRSAYLAMHLTTWWVIIPLCFAALLTGVMQSLGTTWGLFRHYWIVTKLLLTVLATVILLVHTQPIDEVATLAAMSTLSSSDLWQLRLQLVGDASAALFVLFATTMLSVYKPWGMTPYGLRTQFEATAGGVPAAARRSRPAGRYVLLGIVALVLLMLALHLFGIGLHLH